MASGPLVAEANNAAVIPGSIQRSPETSRPLNVTDALSYLDAVKIQFQDKPEVYNKFLDIMKDFKSQQIDTPGVIQRVSRLFHGNPPLIQGFNTFLPVGYRIDVSDNPMDNTITVTTPTGTTTHSTNSRAVPRDIPGFGPNLAQSFVYPGINSPSAMPSILPGTGSISRSLTPQQALVLGHGLPPPYEQPFSPGFQQNPQTAAAASFLGNLNNRNTVEKQQQEFNHAIQYLNKIKARYSDDANTYKQFLDILQTYQKEQRHLQDSQVYVQVQQLFKDAPDLLTEFKDFLPEIAGGNNIQTGPPMLPQAGGPGPTSQSWQQSEMPPGSPDRSPKKASQPLKRKKRPEKELTPVPPAKPPNRGVKKAKLTHRTEGSPTHSPFMAPGSPQPAPTHANPHASNIQAGSQIQHSHQQNLPVPIQSGTSSSEKLMFFDRAKKSLENRAIYEEFLKLLGLFSKEILDVKTLLDRAQVFLGDGDLMTEFKGLMGWDSRQENVENGPPGSIRTGPPEALSAQPVDDGQGPSYRRLPASEVRLACSGRDELCRSVLNDEWVSHPTWASEEAGFLTLKKNSFEDALHKSEEERHEYHVHLEAMSRTISILEPLAARIEEMPAEERAAFKLKADFGGPSKCIYHRIIKKVYGRDSGLEIIQALQDCPGVAVPVVISRLKQKDEEWRRAHREWGRTWREVDSKNFYKSVDHQGISFKANDKKNITAKHFVADIEAIRNQQLEDQAKDSIPVFTRGSVGFQLEYQMQDTAILHDSLKMIYTFLDRSQGQYGSLERRSVERFLRTFVPLLFMYPAAEFNAACASNHDGLSGDDDSIIADFGIENTKNGRRSAGSLQPGAQSGGVAAGDLRKKLLKTAKDKAEGRERTRGESASTGVSRAASPFGDSRHRSPLLATSLQEEEAPQDVWIRESSTTVVNSTWDRNSSRANSESERPFFANATFYTLLRLLQLLYSRLLMCKEIGQRLATKKHADLLSNPVAVELGLDDPNGPATVLAQAMEVNNDANVVYMYLMDACDKVFSGDLDQIAFEEHMRWFFGNKAYHLFTLDKLIIALVKQVQTIISDAKCQELWTLFQGAHNSDTFSNQDIIRYRREAERHVGQDDPLYRIQWVRDSESLRISLMRPEDASVDGERTAISRWREYVDTYVLKHRTEWLPGARKESAAVFLKRTRTDKRKTLSEGEMSIGISLPSYKIVYERGSEEFVIGNRDLKLEERARRRNEERKKSRWLVE
ncbi:hypothetical protein K435DRAFT_655423 [Dendrothele bispora CBS 962.96]|uniref:Histone deacetylase interacting domain-containing protein n=1 Tax=Dendrothele bispora (strain CBS 962.96) TaxID=1314807 RepID=A0A4S8MFM5_DENBC|nr:hypothetical protein K435DRAFT_655423 [Dendrothele bispora CBS 962.96]